MAPETQDQGVDATQNFLDAGAPETEAPATPEAQPEATPQDNAPQEQPASAPVGNEGEPAQAETPEQALARIAEAQKAQEAAEAQKKLDERIAALEKQPTPRGQPAPQEVPQPPKGNELNAHYGKVYAEMELPKCVVEALQSGDAAKAEMGIKTLLAHNAVAQAQSNRAELAYAVTNLAKHFNSLVEKKFSEAQKSAADLATQQAQASQQQSAVTEQVRAEFHAKYPTLKDPKLGPIVLEVATQLATQQNKQNWDTKFGDDVAQEVFKRYPALRQTANGSYSAPNGGARPNSGAVKDVDPLNLTGAQFLDQPLQ